MKRIKFIWALPIGLIAILPLSAIAVNSQNYEQQNTAAFELTTCVSQSESTVSPALDLDMREAVVSEADMFEFSF